jgi:hypothetical protein
MSCVGSSRECSHHDMLTNEMPEDEMPQDTACRLIEEKLGTDGNPALKYVHLVLLNEYYDLHNIVG